MSFGKKKEAENEEEEMHSSGTFGGKRSPGLQNLSSKSPELPYLSSDIDSIGRLDENRRLSDD